MNRCGHDDDAEFLDKVRAARSVDWSGVKADGFWRDEMRKLVLALAHLFPELEEGEVLTRTWQVVQNLDLDRAEDCPRAWVMSTARWRLRDLSVKLEEPERLVERLNLLERPVVASSPADAFLDEVPWCGEEIQVWDIITEYFFVRFRWPRENAVSVVAMFQELVEEVAFDCKPRPTIDVVADKLKDVPKGLKRPVARFVFARYGFLWALLKGIDPNRALLLPDVKKELESIIWPEAAVRASSRARAGGLSLTMSS